MGENNTIKKNNLSAYTSLPFLNSSTKKKKNAYYPYLGRRSSSLPRTLLVLATALRLGIVAGSNGRITQYSKNNRHRYCTTRDLGSPPNRSLSRRTYVIIVDGVCTKPYGTRRICRPGNDRVSKTEPIAHDRRTPAVPNRTDYD